MSRRARAIGSLPSKKNPTRTAGGRGHARSKNAVLGAPTADKLVVSAKSPDGLKLYVVDRAASGLQMQSFKTLDEMRAADLVLKGVQAEELEGNLELVEETTDF